jgi:hypothetical protein
MTGSTARRCLLGLVVAVAGLVMAAPASAAPASATPAAGPLNVQRAPNDPPDVHGLNISDTVKVLQSWNKGVVIIFDPDLRQLPNGATQENVVASRDALVTPSSTASPQQLKEFSAALGPRVLVTLGAVMPDLTGLTDSQARTILANRGLAFDPTPDRPPATWVVTGQGYPSGSVVEFSAPIPAAFGPPVTPPPPPPPPRPGLKVSLPVAIGIGAGALLLLVLLTTFLVRGLRRGNRPEKKQQDKSHRPEHIEVHAFAGQVTGPDVFDLPGAPPVASVPPPREVRS